MGMSQPENQERKGESTDPGDAAQGWSEEGRRWYEELKAEESTIAPWLSLEWTGERMRVRRG